MGTIAARKCYEILQNVKNIVAIEFLAASQGIDLLKYKPSYEKKMREIMENPL